MRFLLALLAVAVAEHRKCRRFSHEDDDEDDPSNNVPEVILSALPHTYTRENELPRNFDWRNVDGVNYVTVDLNQHAPVYCGSCWLHGSISSLNDRLKIAKRAQFPEINLARQVVLNCGNTTAGSCSGGGDYGLYVFAHKYGIPDDTCQLYSAQEYPCSAFRNCMNCDPPTLKAPLGVCYPVQSYTRYFVSEYGKMKNPSIHQMKAEIFRRGPISCSVDANYLTRGRYRPGEIVRLVKPENSSKWDLDHIVSIAGWGVDEGTGIEFWIVRNSWGTFWLSDQGWLHVEMGKNVIGIETECNWAAVSPKGVRDDWGPSDVEREFASSFTYPQPGSETLNSELFGFVEDPIEVIPTPPPHLEIATDMNKTGVKLPELHNSII